VAVFRLFQFAMPKTAADNVNTENGF